MSQNNNSGILVDPEQFGVDDLSQSLRRILLSPVKFRNLINRLML